MFHHPRRATLRSAGRGDRRASRPPSCGLPHRDIAGGVRERVVRSRTGCSLLPRAATARCRTRRDRQRNRGRPAQGGHPRLRHRPGEHAAHGACGCSSPPLHANGGHAARDRRRRARGELWRTPSSRNRRPLDGRETFGDEGSSLAPPLRGPLCRSPRDPDRFVAASIADAYFRFSSRSPARSRLLTAAARTTEPAAGSSSARSPRRRSRHSTLGVDRMPRKPSPLPARARDDLLSRRESPWATGAIGPRILGKITL